MLGSIVFNRWFPFVDLGLALLAGVLWMKGGARFGWVILLLALLPWGMRVTVHQPAFRRTRLDWPLLLFLLTAVLGVWTAVNFGMAAEKFWLIVGSIILFYALAGQSRRDVWLVAAVLGVVAAGIAGYFLLTNDWGAPTADYFGPIRSVGLLLMRVRPSLPLPVFHPNKIAGMLVILVPFILASALYAWQKRWWNWLLLALTCGGLAALGLLLTGAIGAWLALAAGLAVWLFWEVGGFVSRKGVGSQTAVFLLLLAGAGVVGIVVTGLAVGRVTAVNYSLAQRYDLLRQTMYLIDDFSIIGGGLGSFPPLYSEYIRVIPFFFVLYSNLFLDVWLELSFVGLLIFLLLMGLSFWLLYSSRIGPAENRRTADETQSRRRKVWSRRELYLFRWAAFVSILAMALHGLTDDALYGGQGTPFLFLGIGMAVVLSRRRSRRKPMIIWTRGKLWMGGTAVLAALVLVLVLLFHRPLLARWYVNAGAGQMARVDLAIWPSNNWGGFHSEMAYEPAARQFNRALAYDPDNRAAHHRLGLIAMKTGDYVTAVSHLETAYSLSPDHRGIRKSLGYSYVWLGEFDQALDILTPISELPMEMAGFQAWWINRDQPELSDNAEKMGAIFIEDVKPPQ